MLLRIDGSLFKLLSKIADFVIVNVLTLVCSLPIVTIGAAFTANYRIMQKIASEQDCAVIPSYFRAFVSNFRQATAIYLLLILVLFVLGADAYIVHNYLQGDGAFAMNVLLLLVGFATLATAAYVFPLIARYDNTIKQHLKNAFLLALGNLLRTIMILLLYSVPVILGRWSTTVLVESLGLWALFGISAITYFHTRLLKPLFLKLGECHEQEQSLGSSSGKEQESV